MVRILLNPKRNNVHTHFCGLAARLGMNIYNSWSFENKADKFKNIELFSPFAVKSAAESQLVADPFPATPTASKWMISSAAAGTWLQNASSRTLQRSTPGDLVAKAAHYWNSLLVLVTNLSPLMRLWKLLATQQVTASQMAQLFATSPADVSFVNKSASKKSKSFVRAKKRKLVCSAEMTSTIVVLVKLVLLSVIFEEKNLGHFAAVCQKWSPIL